MSRLASYDIKRAIYSHPDFIKEHEELIECWEKYWTSRKKKDFDLLVSKSKKMEKKYFYSLPVSMFKKKPPGKLDRDPKNRLRKGRTNSVWVDQPYFKKQYPPINARHIKHTVNVARLSQWDKVGKLKSLKDVKLPTQTLGKLEKEVTGKYLYLVVDISRKKKDLLKDFNEEIDFFKKFAPKNKNRERIPIYDPWEIYDMHHFEGLNFAQIARKLSGFIGNPSHNEKLMAVYKQVKRAYGKADAAMKLVDEHIDKQKHS